MNMFHGPISTGPYPRAYGYHQLQRVLEMEDIEMARKMLQAGAHIEGSYSVSRQSSSVVSMMFHGTPLHFAVCMRMFQKVKLLLEHGANVNVVEGRWLRITPLHSIAGDTSDGNSAEITQLLIDYGADIEARDCYGATPLSTAATTRDNGYAPVAEVLLKNGADVNTIDCTGNTPLHDAVRMGCVDAVQILIAYGANMLIVSTDGRTAEDMIQDIMEPAAAVLIKAEFERVRVAQCEAFAMGQHKRLGDESWVHSLSEEGVRMVLGFL